MIDVVIIGSSGHAKVIIDIFEKSGEYNILGLIDSFRVQGEQTLGYPILGDENILTSLYSQNKKIKAFVAIGDNFTRHCVVDKLIKIEPTISFVNAVHPSAQIGKNVAIGVGSAVMAGSVINSNTKIGDFCIMNTKSSIDHDCEMHDFSSIAPSCTTGGYVTIGAYSAICIGSTIKDRIIIGEHSVVGAGSLVIKNCDSYSVYYGSPAQKIRARKINEKYL